MYVYSTSCRTASHVEPYLQYTIFHVTLPWETTAYGTVTLCGYRMTVQCPNLVPTPPPFLPSVCVHNNEDQRKTGKAWEHRHVSGRKVDVRGGGECSNMYALNLKASFLVVKMNHFCSHYCLESKTAIEHSNG